MNDGAHMSIGMVAFLFGMAAFLAVYGFKPPTSIKRSELDVDTVGVVPTNPNDTGLFNRIVRPAVRNILPQTPLAAQLKARNSHKTIELLVRSGNPWNIQPEEFFGIRVLGGIVGFFTALVLTLMGMLPDMLPAVAWLLGGIALGAHVPKVLLDGHKGRRLKEARRGLPEALDLLVITLDSGMNFAPALAEVVDRLPAGVIKDELGRVSADLRAGKTLSATLTDFARRHGLTIVSVDELASYRRSLAPDGADRLAKDGA